MENQKPVSLKRDKLLYCLFFAGQNFLWAFVGFILNLMTDLNINPTAAALVILIPKLWDAINDTFFGYIVDKVRIKGQKFMPWIRIGVTAIILASLFMFNAPLLVDDTVLKCVFIVVGYVLFDTCYTMLDAPAFAMPNYMTTNIQERTSIISIGKLGGVFAAVLATVLIGPIKQALGWGGASIIFIVLGVGLMYPFALLGKERFTSSTNEVQEAITFKQMGQYLKKNDMLFVVLIALFVCGLTCVEGSMAMYVAENCYKDGSFQTVIGAVCSIPVILIAVFIPIVAKKIDKFYILLFGLGLGFVANVITYFVGFENKAISIIFVGLKCCGLAFFQIILYMLIADSVEYGAYKSGTHADGITFSLQTFVSKLKGAIMVTMIGLLLGAIGFVEGTGVVQTPEVNNGIWGIFNLLPAGGYLVSFVLLLFTYKLRDKDVEKMAAYNNGKISMKDIEDNLVKKYGNPSDIH